MRTPAIMAALLAAAVSFEIPPSSGTAGPVPVVLVLERTDAAVRAEGLVARRTAVYADGSVLFTRGCPTFGRGHLDARALSELAGRVAAARLSDLPEVVEARADWFDVGNASCSLQWSASGTTEVRIEGDLRPAGPDRALAPHGFVEVLEYLESIPLQQDPVDLAPDADVHVTAIDFALEPWTDVEASPFAALVELEPIEWPTALPAPRNGSFRAEGSTARDLFEAARLAQPVRWDGRSWRLRARLLFPHETRAATATGPTETPQHG